MSVHFLFFATSFCFFTSPYLFRSGANTFIAPTPLPFPFTRVFRKSTVQLYTAQSVSEYCVITLSYFNLMDKHTFTSFKILYL